MLIELFAWLGPAYLASVTLPLAIIDLRQHRLPNRLVLPGFPITLAGQIIASLSLGHSQLVVALIVALTTFGLSLIANRYLGLGMGDVKLLTLMALALSWFEPSLIAIAIFLASMAAGIVVSLRLLYKKAGMGQKIALGPYLLLGFMVCLPLAYSPGLVIDSTSRALSSCSMVSFSPST